MKSIVLLFTSLLKLCVSAQIGPNILDVYGKSDALKLFENETLAFLDFKHSNMDEYKLVCSAISTHIPGTSRLDMKKKFRKSGGAVAQAARVVVESLPPEVLKNCVDAALRNMVSGPGADGLMVGLGNPGPF